MSTLETPRRAALRALALVVFGLVAGFCALEGGSSLVLFGWNLVRYQAPQLDAEGHVIFDRDLGWVGKPNTEIKDVYGPGSTLRTNAQGFRHPVLVTPSAPADRLRLVCSGDSFTFGSGVGDDETWCHLLGRLDDRFETVNMGQEGYGLDQAYLWYERNGSPLEHAVHVVAFITSDFYRMRSPYFFGHRTPSLKVENGKLVTYNVPVPEESGSMHPLLRRFQVATIGLKLPELLKAVRRRSAPSGGPKSKADFDEPTWKIAAAVFSALAEQNRAKGSTLVLLYLPMEDEEETDAPDPWREHVRAEADRLGVAYVDLVAPYRTLSPRFVDSTILGADRPGAGHYTAAGNRWVAEALIDRLRNLPPVAERLKRLPAAAVARP